MTIDQRIMDVYDAMSVERVGRGILDHTLDVLTLDGWSVEEAMIEELRAAGRLPEGHETP